MSEARYTPGLRMHAFFDFLMSVSYLLVVQDHDITRVPSGSISILLLLGLLAKIKVLGVLPAHSLVSVPPLSCAGFVCCHCTGRWAVLDNTHGKDSGAFR